MESELDVMSRNYQKLKKDNNLLSQRYAEVDIHNKVCNVASLNTLH